MPSVVDICNQSMDLLGASTIISLDENSKEARLCSRRFDTVRDAVLRSHPWNCAIVRQELAEESVPPSFGFAHQFLLPLDPYCLRVLSFFTSTVDAELSPYDSQVMYKIEGRKILSDEQTCRITYLARVTNTEDFDSLLTNAIAYRLASETAYAITGSNSVAQSMYGLYEQRLKDAKSMDALEGKPDRIIADVFTNIRL
tara:strand:- start:2098 stop:2694 length:597 start_codon:yes stop_codon:yes gene_type:complete